MSSKAFLYSNPGSRSVESVIGLLGDVIAWDAYRLADSDGPAGIDHTLVEDLEQEARLAAFRILERDPLIWPRKLQRLVFLSMLSARRRGRSVLRPDPYKRQRVYQRVPLSQMTPQDVCQQVLSPGQEEALLLHALSRAEAEHNHKAEHQALLALRRLAQRMHNEPLAVRARLQLTIWWRRERQEREVVS